jgi:hypothetical protein
VAAVFSIPRDQLLDNLDAIISGQLAGSICHLYWTTVTPTPASVVGDFSEVVWTGYAPQSTNTWSSAALVGDIAFTDSGLMSFPVTSGGTGNTVFGYYVTDAGGTVLRFAELLNTPITVLNGVPIQLRIRYRNRNA